MPLFESESLVLRSYDLSEADRIVVFFTREHGIVRGVAKGAKRLKSRFGSSLEPFSTVRLQYFQKDDRELVSIQQVELSDSRFDAAADPDFLNTFAYLADLLTAMVPPHDPNETTYRMVKACVSADLRGKNELAAIRLYFELWLLRLGGYLPDWAKCGDCGQILPDDREPGLWRDLHLICGNCQGSRKMAAVSGLSRSLFVSVKRLTPAAYVQRARTEPDAVRELSGLLRHVIVNVVGREIAAERTLAANL
ncbi:MAG: DNA repair protein RecO [Acidobacteria bacterium]|nr:DNA repair protein RecO [Acidobacteriota bacterium]